MPLQAEWLVEVAPHYYKKKDLESLGLEKKMGKGQGAAGEKSRE
jgi:pre-mRNA-splicing factor ATP-dependent RNA helicase DHX16